MRPASKQNVTNAIADCERAVEIDPTYTKAWLRLAKACLMRKRPHAERAETASLRALELDPSIEEARATLDKARQIRAKAEAPKENPAPETKAKSEEQAAMLARMMALNAQMVVAAPPPAQP